MRHICYAVLIATFGFSPLAKSQPTPATTTAANELPKSSQSGAPIQFELWSWGDDEAGRKKIRDLKDGDRIPMEPLPDSVQFRFRITTDHNGLVFKARSADGEHKLGWDSKNLKASPDSPASQQLYRAQSDGYYPNPGKYCLEVKGTKGGNSVADSVINIEFFKAPRKPYIRSTNYASTVGMIAPFPKSSQSGAAIQSELWEWKDKKGKKLMDIKDGAKIPVESLPPGIQFQFRVNADFDAITCRWRSSDGVPEAIWPQKNLKPSEAGPQNLFRASNLGFFPQIGLYCLEVTAEKAGKIVAQNCVNIELIRTKPIPTNTTFLTGKKDWKGNVITSSKPVNLGPLNETPVLKDNDYAFAPQKAFSVINWERFPPFRMHPRFPLVWASRRFNEEDKFGGPLNRGFTTLSAIDSKQDNLKISERSHFDYPGHLVAVTDDLYKKDPVKYRDLKLWKDHRLSFISPENGVLMGRMIYDGWNPVGWHPYDPGIHAWDEEEMFAPIATNMMKDQSDKLPAYLLKYRDKVLAGDVGAKMAVEREYDKAMAEFVGNTYKGARLAAAERGRKVKIWHYGSRSPGHRIYLFDGEGPGIEINPKTGKYPYEELETGLHEWFKKGHALDFDATAYSREIDYFHHDFYFHVVSPQEASLYEKDKSGNYVLDEKGRRKYRKDKIEEAVYAEPTKMINEDYGWGPIFLKSFIAKGENAQFWFNGGKYYKSTTTQITDKKMIPYIRPGNQSTFGESGKFGDRPVSPYMAEATTIFTFLIGCEGLFVWDAPKAAVPVGYGVDGKPAEHDMIGDLEYAVKGLHRVSQFNKLFDGNYSFVRPTRHYNTHNRDHPIIRGLINGQYLVLGMTNPYLDIGEKQDVEVWYDSPYSTRTAKWAGKAVMNARKTHIYQCKLPPLPAGQAYDPDKLYFRYTLKDGKHTETFTVSGNYDVKYPFPN